MRDGMLGDNKVLHDLWCGPLLDFMQKANGSEGEDWRNAFKRFLRKEHVIWSQFPVWKTVEPSPGGRSKGWFLSALDSAGIRITEPAEMILKTTPISFEGTPVKLILVSGQELGFEGVFSLNEIYKRAELYGLSLCEKEIGPQLLSQFNDFEEGNVNVASEPIFDQTGLTWVFTVGCNRVGRSRKFILGATGAGPRFLFPRELKWVFAWR